MSSFESCDEISGLMAQDVARKKPEAIVKGPGGIKMVDYELALKGV